MARTGENRGAWIIAGAILIATFIGVGVWWLATADARDCKRFHALVVGEVDPVVEALSKTPSSGTMTTSEFRAELITTYYFSGKVETDEETMTKPAGCEPP